MKLTYLALPTILMAQNTYQKKVQATSNTFSEQESQLIQQKQDFSQANTFKSFIYDIGLIALTVPLSRFLRKNITIQHFNKTSIFQRMFKLNQDQLKKQLQQKVTNFNFNKHTLSYNQPIYGTDFIKVGLQNKKSIQDPLFGVTVKSQDSFGLERRLEAFHKNEWRSSKIYKNPLFITNDIKLGNLDISHINLDKIAKEYVRLKIDSTQINQVHLNYVSKTFSSIYELLIPDYLGKYGRIYQYDQDDMQTLAYEINQRNKIISSKIRKFVWFDEDFIYITEQQNEFQDGDLRVSFYELKHHSEISVFSNQLKKRFVNKDSYFFLGKEYGKIQLNDFEVILPGKVSQLELIQNILNSLQTEVIQGEIQLVQSFSQNNKNQKYQFLKSPFLSYSLLCSFLLFYYYIFSNFLELDSFSWPLLMTFIHSNSIGMLTYGIINTPTAIFVIGGSHSILWILSSILNCQNSQITQNITYLYPNIIQHYQEFREKEKIFINMLQNTLLR
ncbi:hypothetical protein ABPG74_005246 [Tetrahymena malaccensis]